MKTINFFIVLGNCKLKLLGHNAPVTRLQLDPTGKILLSGDLNNQDYSIRLWDLSSGKKVEDGDVLYGF